MAQRAQRRSGGRSVAPEVQTHLRDLAARWKELDDEEQIVAVARLIYEHNLDQQDIADELPIHQTTISRWMAKAHEIGLVHTVVRGRPHQAAEHLLRESLLSKGVRRVVVVPDNMFDSRNISNLSKKAADIIIDLIEKNNRPPPIRITMSCGETLQAVSNELSNILLNDPERAERIRRIDVEFYAATLWSGAAFELDTAYPQVLVTAMFSRLGHHFKNMRFFAPQLGPELSTAIAQKFDESLSLGEENIGKFRDELAEYFEKLKNSHIIVTGIGTVAGEGYKRAHKRAYELLRSAVVSGSPEPILPEGDLPEMCYQIVSDENKPVHPAFKVAGITIAQLREAARAEAPRQDVVAVAGGHAKHLVLSKLLQQKNLPFNIFVTDIGTYRQFEDNKKILQK